MEGGYMLGLPNIIEDNQGRFARENALNFYRSCGYTLLTKTHLLYGIIQHYQMRKDLL